MFTGLIEEIGIVQTLTRSGAQAQFTVAAQRVVTDLKVGDSIAVNGACLTAIAVAPQAFTADVSPETLAVTTLGTLPRRAGQFGTGVAIFGSAGRTFCPRPCGHHCENS
jgi:riboflavin synthase alpha subunit